MAEKVGGIYYEVSADTSKLVQAQRQVDASTKQMAFSFNAVAIAAKALAIAYSMIKTAQLADDMRLLSARVLVAAGSIDAATVAMSELQRISTKTQTSIAASATIFQRLNGSILQMGGNQSDTLRVTELLGMAVKVSGASAQEASSAMIQFGQAMGSGKLAGDELRSLMENAPYLMRQLADSLGVPIGALKKLGEDGKLTADVVTNALTKAAARIEADFAQMPKTMAGAFQVAKDAGDRLAEKLDDLSGKSAMFTGATTGLGMVLDKLAQQFGAVNEKAGDLGRNQTIETWAKATRLALSYVIDAADLTWQTLSVLGRNVAFVFEGIGKEIGGIGAQVSAVVRGDFAGARAVGEAMKAESAQRRKDLDAADARTLGRTKLFGQQMREAWEQGAGGGRGFVNPEMKPSKLKPPKIEDDKKKAKFDGEGYLAGLEKATLDGLERIDQHEREALRKNAELLKEKKITAAQAARGITLIELNAQQEREDIQRAFGETRRKIIEEDAQKEAELKSKLAEQQKRGLMAAQDMIVGGDPIRQLELRLIRESELLTQYAMQDMENAKLYAEAKVALEQETARRVAEIKQREIDTQQQNAMQSVAIMADMTAKTYSLLEQGGRDRTALGKALFLAQKALAIAEILMNTEVAASKAGAQAGIFGIPMAALIRAQGYAAAGTVAGTAIANVAGGRQYGGPVNSGDLYRINEGGKPEMFTAANGNQYMMPTADGNVTPAGKAGRGGVAQTVQVTQHFHFSQPQDNRTMQQLGAAASRGIGIAAARNN